MSFVTTISNTTMNERGGGEFGHHDEQQPNRSRDVREEQIDYGGQQEEENEVFAGFCCVRVIDALHQLEKGQMYNKPSEEGPIDHKCYEYQVQEERAADEHQNENDEVNRSIADDEVHQLAGSQISVKSSEVIDINNDCRTSQECTETPIGIQDVMEAQSEGDEVIQDFVTSSMTSIADDDLQQLVENQVSVDSWEVNIDCGTTQKETLANEIMEISI
jgi:hypothetical protein